MVSAEHIINDSEQYQHFEFEETRLSTYIARDDSIYAPNCVSVNMDT